MSIDIIIPVYHKGKEFYHLLSMLFMQTVKPGRIILMVTEDIDGEVSDELERLHSVFDQLKIPGKGSIQLIVQRVEKEQFDHGGTRHLGASLSDAEYLVFMTQDAMPSDFKLLERLLYAVKQENIAAAFARQLAREDAGIIETYTRIFNYPSQSSIKTKDDLKQFGIKTYFCSNVCAIYRKSVYIELGGFCRKAIFNEDMIFAAKLIQAGYGIAYAADAKVVHSHNYSCVQQFRRNFDLAVSQADHPEVFASVPSEKEGIRLVKQTFQFLIDQRDYFMAGYLLVQSAAKYFGYFLGKNYKILPDSVIKAATMSPSYWKSR